jgi:hypothetical protein
MCATPSLRLPLDSHSLILFSSRRTSWTGTNPRPGSPLLLSNRKRVKKKKRQNRNSQNTSIILKEQDPSALYYYRHPVSVRGCVAAALNSKNKKRKRRNRSRVCSHTSLKHKMKKKRENVDVQKSRRAFRHRRARSCMLPKKGSTGRDGHHKRTRSRLLHDAALSRVVGRYKTCPRKGRAPRPPSSPKE